MNRWTSSRRDLIKRLGIGAACLPILNATAPLRAATIFPTRLIVVVQTNGLANGIWRDVGASTSLAQLTLPESLKPLEPFKNQLIILPGLSNPEYDGAGHGAYGTTFSGGPNNPDGEYWTPKVATLDQICADAVAKSASLTMRTLPMQVNSDQGESRLGAHRCFFRGNNQPITPEINPYKTAERLFAGKMMGDPALDRLRAERRSMLDFVKGDIDRFAKNLGTDDRRSITAHLDSIREIEKGLSSAGPIAADCNTSPNLGQPLDPLANDNYPKLLELTLDMAVAALRCDVTRVATVQLGNAFGGNLMFTWLGIRGTGLEYPTRTWHDVAHQEVSNGVNDKVAVDKWFMTHFAALLDRLSKVPEGTGTMLDNTIVLWANHMETGGGHNAMSIPWLIGGKGGGVLKTGQLLRGTGNTQISKTGVMCEIANAMGAGLPFYGAQSHGAPLPAMRV
jgi:Protein of unknown function (DUF1552)